MRRSVGVWGDGEDWGGLGGEGVLWNVPVVGENWIRGSESLGWGGGVLVGVEMGSRNGSGVCVVGWNSAIVAAFGILSLGWLSSW